MQRKVEYVDREQENLIVVKHTWTAKDKGPMGIQLVPNVEDIEDYDVSTEDEVGVKLANTPAPSIGTPKKLKEGMVLRSMNGETVMEWSFAEIMEAIKEVGRPITLKFQGKRYGGEEDEDDQDLNSEYTEDALFDELRNLSKKEMIKRARQAGAYQDEIDDALDDDQPKDALIELIVDLELYDSDDEESREDEGEDEDGCAQEEEEEPSVATLEVGSEYDEEGHIRSMVRIVDGIPLQFDSPPPHPQQEGPSPKKVPDTRSWIERELDPKVLSPSQDASETPSEHDADDEPLSRRLERAVRFLPDEQGVEHMVSGGLKEIIVLKKVYRGGKACVSL